MRNSISSIARAATLLIGVLGIQACAPGRSPHSTEAQKAAASFVQSRSLWDKWIGRVQAVSPSVLTERYDGHRTGSNLNESVLNPVNVRPGSFGKLFSRQVDGDIYAQPLYVPNVVTPQGTKNIVYVATAHNTVFAFDADDSAATTPLWTANLGSPVLSADISATYANISPEIGIIATPVIDAAKGLLYVESSTRDGQGGFHHWLVGLDIAYGTQKASVEIHATVNGTGDASNAGKISFDPLKSLCRPGLLLLNGVIYLAYGSHEDQDPYHGWILGYSASTLKQVSVFNVSPNGSRGAIWQSGGGLTSDDSGSVYAMTGNGTFDAGSGGSDYGDSFLKLSAALQVQDWFTPSNQATLDAQDNDLGSGGVLAIPGTTIIAGAGKDGILRVLNSQNLGHFDAATDHVTAEFQATTGFFSTPNYWNGSAGPLVYLWGSGDVLKSFAVQGNSIGSTPVQSGKLISDVGCTNTVQLAISSNGSTPGTGLIWSLDSTSGDPTESKVSGILRVYDASDLGSVIWDSEKTAADHLGQFAKFNVPTVVNGKVFAPTFSKQLVVYGLLAPVTLPSPQPTLQPSPLPSPLPPASSDAYQIVAQDPSGNVANIDTTFTTLSTYQPQCNPSVALSGVCNAAINRFCQAHQWGGGGYGAVEHLGDAAAVVCFSAQAESLSVISFAVAQSYDASCDPGNPYSVNCNAAANRFCTASGYAAGFGPVEYVPTAMMVSCMSATYTTYVHATFTELTRYHASCNASSPSISDACNAAINRDCTARGFVGGVGILEFLGDDVTFACFH